MRSGDAVTAEMLEDLPKPVQRKMRYTDVVGKPWIDTIRLEQAGPFCPGLDRPWMSTRDKQVYTTNPPGFVWNARFRVLGLPLLRARDEYRTGQGHMLGKVAGLFTVFGQLGDELDQGTMVRYLNE